MIKPNASFAIIFILLIANAVPKIRAQPLTATPAHRRTLAQNLTVSPDANNGEALAAFFPTSIIGAQTPIAIRYAYIYSICVYQVYAACHPVALSFFGKKDPIPKRFCSSADISALLPAYLYYLVQRSEFPNQARILTAYFTRIGVNPNDPSTSGSTPIGWARNWSKILVNYFAKDGWNSQGKQSRSHYLQRFEDYTAYKPTNPADLASTRLNHPLRWQPLTAAIDLNGWYGHQIHVTPQIGTDNVRPVGLSPKEFNGRKAKPLYQFRNKKGPLSRRDALRASSLIQKLFGRASRLTKRKVAIAYFWENKFASLGITGFFYRKTLGFGENVAAPLTLTEMIAQHDALLLAWKEKRRHDLVRPVTLIRHRLNPSQMVTAWKNGEQRVGAVKAGEWESVLPTQPHSEYPSASAIICQASFEAVSAGLTKLALKKNQKIPPFESSISPFTVPNLPMADEFKVRFNTLEQAARSCGESRLDAGVHFEPAVTEGFRLGKGIGKIAFDHVYTLMQGRVPANCERCKI